MKRCTESDTSRCGGNLEAPAERPRISYAHRGRNHLAEVLAIGVLPEYRTPEFVHRPGLRVGEELIAHVMSYFRSVGVDRARMVVEAHNKPALLFYHRLGGRGFDPYEHAGEPMVHVWFDLREPADRPAEVETQLPGATSRGGRCSGRRPAESNAVS